MILLILFPSAFLLLPGRHEWNLTGQEAMAHCCAGHCPLAQAAHVSLCVQQEKWFSFSVSDEIWSLCGAFVGRASGALLEAPLPSLCTLGPWCSSGLGTQQDMEFKLHVSMNLIEGRAFAVRNKNQVTDGGLQQLEMEPVPLLGRSRGCDTQEIMEPAAASLEWD